jgi:hypothetical protein
MLRCLYFLENDIDIFCGISVFRSIMIFHKHFLSLNLLYLPIYLSPDFIDHAETLVCYARRTADHVGWCTEAINMCLH